MQKYHPVIIFLLGFIAITTRSYAQQTNQFEGVITYSHQVTAVAPGYNVQQDYGYIGRQSAFYYKQGKYKWLNENAFMQMDMFRSKDTVEFLQLRATDTILYARNNFSNEKIIDYKILKNADTVLGKICNVLVVKAISNGNEWTRRYSFTGEPRINAALFTRYKYNSTGFMYGLMKALPLRIELIYPNRKITYTATNIKAKKMEDSFFEFAPGTPFKSLL